MAFSALNVLARGTVKLMGGQLKSVVRSAKIAIPVDCTSPINARLLSHMSKKWNQTDQAALEGLGWNKNCGVSKVHTKGDAELVQFLADEIAAESKAQKSPKLPKIEGFDIKTEKASVTLTKTFNDETITVKFNVNHTVDTDLKEGSANPDQDKPEMGEMKSKPQFTVEIEKSGKVLGFSCSFVDDYNPQEETDPDAFNDNFNIDEVVFHTGEWKDKTYAVSGEIIDGYLYDLLMNILEERGVSSDFGEKLIEFSTSYEHKLYISLLENVKAFFSGGKS